MNVLLQKHEAKRIFPVPEGLRELSSDIVREVLRHQPECIHVFIAEYLETMLIIREKARDSTIILSDIFREAYFYENICKTKNVTRQEINEYASIIQMGWRNYALRKKFRSYLMKKKRMEEEKEAKKATRIENYLKSLGITYDEATRAACAIQAAYRQANKGKWMTDESGEEWIPGDLQQELGESDIASDRYERWGKDFENFFEIDEEGEIMYKWPRLGQLRKIQRAMLQPDMSVVTFFAVRDQQGTEQYSYLIKQQKGIHPKGFPIGFLIPMPKERLPDKSQEVKFIKEVNNIKMGNYTYVFEKCIEKTDLDQLANFLDASQAIDTGDENINKEIQRELEYDPDWVVPKIMIQISKGFLTEMHDEVFFVAEGFVIPKDIDGYTFRAESTEVSLKVINYLLRSKCATIEEAIRDAENMPEYRLSATGRFLPVDDFDSPKSIQKVVIMPESSTGKLENDDMDKFEYVFVPEGYKWRVGISKPDNPIKIPMTRFRGYRSDYKGSEALVGKIFVMGPMMNAPDEKPITFESFFWDNFGLESWFQLLCTTANKKIARLREASIGEEAEEVSDSEEGIEKPEMELTGEEEIEIAEEPKVVEKEEVPHPLEEIELAQEIRPQELPSLEQQEESAEEQQKIEQPKKKAESELEEGA